MGRASPCFSKKQGDVGYEAAIYLALAFYFV